MVKHTSVFELSALLSSLFLLAVCACGEDEGCWDVKFFDEYAVFDDVHVSPEGSVFVVGDTGPALIKNGETWESMDSAWGDGIWACSDERVFMTNWGVVYTYDGDGWSELLRTGNKFKDIWAVSETDVFIVGYEQHTLPGPSWARIFHYDGEQWEEMENEFETFLHGVWGSSASDMFAVGSEERDNHGSEGTILHYDGVSWSLMKGELEHGLNSVWGASHDDVFAVGDGGLILHYDGNEWSQMQSGALGRLMDVWGASSSEVYVVGQKILYYDGETWMDVRGDLYYRIGIYSVWGTSPTDVYAVGGKSEDPDLNGVILQWVCEEPGVVR